MKLCALALLLATAGDFICLYIGWQLHKFFTTGEDNDIIAQDPNDR